MGKRWGIIVLGSFKVIDTSDKYNTKYLYVLRQSNGTFKLIYSSAEGHVCEKCGTPSGFECGCGDNWELLTIEEVQEIKEKYIRDSKEVDYIDVVDISGERVTIKKVI